LAILDSLGLVEGTLPVQSGQVGPVSYQLKYKAVRRLNLRIKMPEAQVLVTAPLGMPKRIVESFVQQNQAWILKQQLRIKTQKLPAVRKFITGELLYVWGRPYTLELRIAGTGLNRPQARLEADQLLLYLPEEGTADWREKLLDAWFKQQLEAVLPQVFDQCRQVVGKKESSYYVRKMKTRWGTCNVRTGRICINSGLAHLNPKYLYYIVTHELNHLWVHGHGPAFKSRMDRYCPEWRQAQQGLRESMAQVW
jgi:predicted metal-dependent hydrolase